MAEMADKDEVRRFERLFLPHLDAAYNLACWLTRNDAIARDIVQESCLRAFKALPQFREETPRAWLLTIVRNQSYTALSKIAAEKSHIDTVDFSVWEEAGILTAQHDDPETILMRLQDKKLLEQALNKLPVPFREVLVLKEFEDMSYAEIAVVAAVPVGTVMSRLSRGRRLLKEILTGAHDDRK
jgi:RNA polymerase sigma-70 factor (ECF subfamily)